MSGSVLDPPRLDAPPIDARIRARRIEVRRHEGRRRLRRLVALLVVTVLAAALWGATRSPLLDVDHIEVQGLVHTPVEDALSATGIARGDALLDLDLAQADVALAALPWVSSARVTRSWGGTVTVVVEERTAVARLRAPDDTLLLVDRDGRVLGAAAEGDPATSSLLVVEGLAPGAPGTVLDPLPRALLDLTAAAPEVVRREVEAVEVTAEGETWLRLRPRAGEVDADGVARLDGGRVRLGDLRAVDDQLLAVATMLTQVDLTDLVEMDVRVPSNPVVVARTTAAHADDGADDGAGEGADAAGEEVG